MLKQQHQARLRAELFMKVRCGLITACQAADQLGVSHKTYYKWEQRGLSAMLDSVTDQPPGRPAQPADAHRLELEKQLGGSPSADRPAESQDGIERCADGSETPSNRQRPGEKKMTLFGRRWP